METFELHYFLSVARFENVHRAAEHAAVSPASLSKAISRLEEELGAKLFARQGRNIVLTERVDRLIAPDGGEIGAFAIAGIFELDDDGKLIRWRDYTDPSAIAAIHGH